MRERGLKLHHQKKQHYHQNVAPRAGAWIEIVPVLVENRKFGVAPRAGAWIEISEIKGAKTISHCRSPCGSVD